MFSVSFLVLFFNLATLHGEQDPMCAGRLQGRPPWSQTVSWDDASWVLLQTPPASTPALLQPVPWLHQQEHLHQACLGSNVPVCPSYTDSKLGEINCSLCLVRFTLIHVFFLQTPDTWTVQTWAAHPCGWGSHWARPWLQFWALPSTELLQD